MKKKKKKSPLTRAREQIRDLKDEISHLESVFSEVENDRFKFRKFFVKELRFQIEANGNNEYYTSSEMIERLSKFLGEVVPWYWS